MKISVIIPVFNAEKYVSQAVESALQFDEVYEVILIEDKSPDNSLLICKALENKFERVKLFQHPDKENHGAAASRNLGIEVSVGDYIAFLDADDYFLPNRFDYEKELFKDINVEGVYGAIGVDYYSEKAKQDYYKLFKDNLTTVYQKHDPKSVFLGQIYLLGSFGLFSIDALTIRRDSLIQKMKPMFKSGLILHEDTEFLFRLSYYLNLYPGSLDKAVAMRGVHEDNRITKVDINKKSSTSTLSRELLWNEVQMWSQSESSIPDNVKVHIIRMRRSFEISNAPTLKKWGMIMKYIFLDYQSIRSGLYNINFRRSLL